jgi:hypothetical protein
LKVLPNLCEPFSALNCKNMFYHEKLVFLLNATLDSIHFHAKKLS